MGRQREEDVVELELDYVTESHKAYLVSDGDKEVWLPKSYCKRDGKVFTIPEWMAVEKELV